ncbi:MAG TPA: Ig-like domain-containing protein [Xanthobacteraceae bacterium]
MVAAYTYTPLNDALGTNGTVPFDINDSGQIVGNYVDSNGVLHGFLYSNGTYTSITDPSARTTPGFQTFGTYAHSINDSGQIVGYYVDATTNEVRGFLYSGGTNGTYTTLEDPLADGGNTVPRGINDLGQIVGYYYSGGGWKGFLYSGGTNGTYTDLPDDPSASGGPGVAPLAINDSGQIVGYYNDSNGNSQAFLYSNGIYTTLVPPGASGTDVDGDGIVASGINDTGQVVGWYFDNSGIEHGFLYSGGTNGSYTTLDDPSTTPGTTLVGPHLIAGTAAAGINDLGQIVGYYHNLSGISGFLATPLLPNVTVSIDNTDDNVTNPTGLVTFAFTETPLAFTLADTSAVGGNLSNLQQVNAKTYTATFTAAPNTDIANASVSVNTTASVKFSSAVATFYEVQNNWAPSQMIDGIFTGPPPSSGQDATYGGVNGWSVYDFSAGMADGAVALLTLATPLPAGQYNLTFRIYQNYYGNPGHILGDFALDYTTNISPTLSSPQTPVSIQSASSLNGTTFSVLSPGQLLANTSQNSIGTDTYTISASVDSASPITAIFLDAIKNPALPGDGPGGQYGNGNFVVSEFTLDASMVGSTGAFTVDTETPTVSVSIDNTDINLANPTGLVTFTFSEAPVAFTRDDTSAVGGTLGEVQEINPTTYTATFTGAADTDITNASVDVTAASWQEGNGNPGAGGITNLFTVDTETPTVSVSIDNTHINLLDPSAVATFTFNKAPTEFSLNDVMSLDGSLSNLSGSGTTYTATFTAYRGVDNNTASLSVINGSYHDADGNAGDGGSTTFAVDTTLLGTLWDELSSLLSSVWTNLSDFFAGIIGQHAVTSADLLGPFQPQSSASDQTFTSIEGTHQDSIALLHNYLASTFVTPSDGHGGAGFLNSLVTTISHETPFLGHPSG